jgi:hypothetical protein
MALKDLHQWERALRSVLDRIDDLLEDRFGKDYALTRNRPPRGATANKRYDGLFAVEGKFSLGLGRREGPGYSVDIRMVTFDDVPASVEAQIHGLVGEILREEIPKAFPGRGVEVSEADDGYLIHGDLGWDRSRQ